MTKSGEKLYVQVAYLLASDETVQREFGAYNNIRDNYPKYVVSLDEVRQEQKRDQAPQHPRFSVGRGMVDR